MITTYTWRPVVGDEVAVTLTKLHKTSYSVALASTGVQLGRVFVDAIPERGWRFTRHAFDELRGSQLRDHVAAVSALLFVLRQEGKV